MPVTTRIDNQAKVWQAIRDLASKDVLIGVPQDKASRGGPINNAALAYIHEFGSPKQRIPARPFLRPTILAMKQDIIAAMKKAGELALEGKGNQVNSVLNSLGLKAAANTRKYITTKIPPPLAPATVAARLRRTKRGQGRLRRMRAQGINLGTWGASNLTPLVDTGKLYNAITYVVRDRRTKK
jgi:hypothetical protein